MMLPAETCKWPVHATGRSVGCMAGTTVGAYAPSLGEVLRTEHALACCNVEASSSVLPPERMTFQLAGLQKEELHSSQGLMGRSMHSSGSNTCRQQ